MRAFRGSLVAGLALLVLWGGLSWLEKSAQPGADGSYVKSDAESLFRFEKEEVADATAISSWLQPAGSMEWLMPSPAMMWLPRPQ